MPKDKQAKTLREERKKLLNRVARVANDAYKGRTSLSTSLDYPLFALQVGMYLANIGASPEVEAIGILHAVLDKETPESLEKALAGSSDVETVSRVVGGAKRLHGLGRALKTKYPYPPLVEDLTSAINLMTEGERLAAAVVMSLKVREMCDALNTHGPKGDDLTLVRARWLLHTAYALKLGMSNPGEALATQLNLLMENVLSLSDTDRVRLTDVDEASVGPIGEFARVVAVTTYQMECPRCHLQFQLSLVRTKQTDTQKGQELTCPSCSHRATYVVVSDT